MLQESACSWMRPVERRWWWSRRLRHMTNDEVIFSGIQPTGVPHLGNYLGALRQWVKLQNESSPDTILLFSIVDLHAITAKQDPKQLAIWRKAMLASLLAVGLDPKRCIIFAQSSVKQHAELMWILSCSASMGYLSRMTQWKARIIDRMMQNWSADILQSKLALPENASPLQHTANKDAVKLGLFSYPVLQAADILLYNTTHVPVGEDQAQHLEFSRDLAIGFNHLYASENSTPLLVVPQTLLSPAKRVMSLSSPTKKMSKSDPSPKSRILITDSNETIHSKLRMAITDSIEGVSYDRGKRPGVSNLVDLIYHFDESAAASPEELAADMKDLSLKALKERAAYKINLGLREIRSQYGELMSGDQKQLIERAEDGAKRAEEIAEATMKRVRNAIGMGL
ncbi:tryptophanyl-tRNA synthetase [Ampelomyces quisqualis]|uniref:Tryptophan--tRNA ligase, mitochondrial n=1 Tax=Ampelomyces quisqualis TaxID=50730 RepID=A0A6A5QJK4_AMPQU|nr:tryptophanyl-tRNA synthetase [Ampelomyces quisqualis]